MFEVFVTERFEGFHKKIRLFIIITSTLLAKESSRSMANVLNSTKDYIRDDQFLNCFIPFKNHGQKAAIVNHEAFQQSAVCSYSGQRYHVTWHLTCRLDLVKLLS